MFDSNLRFKTGHLDGHFSRRAMVLLDVVMVELLAQADNPRLTST